MLLFACLLRNAMDEPYRFRTLETARFLSHHYFQDTKRQKLSTSPRIFRKRLNHDQSLPRYEIGGNEGETAAIIRETFGMSDDLFQELFEFMKPPWLSS